MSEWKNDGASRLLDVVLQDVWVLYRINKDDGDECLPLLAFRRDTVNEHFLKYSKESRLLSSHVGIRNILSNICYYDTKHHQQQLCEKQRRCKVCNRTLASAR